MRGPEGEDAGRGRLADNILLFCRTLRRAGVPLGPGEVVDALQAVGETGLSRRTDFYHALRATLVKDAGHFALFHQAFHVWFRNPRLLERAMALVLPELSHEPSAASGEPIVRRLSEALASDGRDRGDEEAETRDDRSQTFSRVEVLRKKDFEQMSLGELREATELMRAEIAPLAARRTRRHRADPVGHRYDLRRSMQLMMRNNGQLLALARRRHRNRRPPVVLMCDISGSMSAYSRMFLHFAHTLATVNPRVHTFVFATRLTNITRQLADGDPDRALAAASLEAQDWDGGTRIAACLEHFNLDWNRRVLAQNAVVVLLTDGLERDSAPDLGLQVRRLGASCRELLWLNPVLRYSGFRPLAQGIRAMLPHVHRFLPAHNLQSLTELSRILGAAGAAAGRAESPARAAWHPAEACE